MTTSPAAPAVTTRAPAPTLAHVRLLHDPLPTPGNPTTQGAITVQTPTRRPIRNRPAIRADVSNPFTFLQTSRGHRRLASTTPGRPPAPGRARPASSRTPVSRPPRPPGRQQRAARGPTRGWAPGPRRPQRSLRPARSPPGRPGRVL